jgi:hypothetical protein
MTDYVESADLQLLRLAGKAVGLRGAVYYEAYPEDGFSMPYAKTGKREYWNPYCKDGDAHRAAVTRQLVVWNDHLAAGGVCCTDRDGNAYPSVFVVGGETLTPEDFAATRRAIVLALAKIGEQCHG